MADQKSETEARFEIEIVVEETGDQLAIWKSDHSEFAVGDVINLGGEAGAVVRRREWYSPRELTLWCEPKP
ncbi:hypothetical protein [Actinoplanes sp. URMC 104]|uniref:hypothetical protein n=1 Tax=Actinoplanes sp. URMC 104 TaxID=3423409 RepID=UPI003F1ABAD3